MRLMALPNRVLRSSTAIAVGLAMSGAPQMVAFAQDAVAPVDCVADAANPACLVEPEAPAAEPEPLPVETPAVEETVVEEPIVETPVVEAPAAVVTPESEPVVEVEAEVAPTQEQPVEAPAEPAVEEPAPPALEVEAEVDTPAEATPAETTPVEAAPAEAAPAEAAPVEETSVEDLPAEAQPAQDEAAQEQPAAEQQAQDAVIEEPAAQTEQPVEQPSEPATTAAQPIEDSPEQPETVANEAAMADERAPASVVADEITAEQSVQIQQQETRRREDARERRNELLGAAAVGAVIGAIIPALGGTVVEDQGDRLIIERNGEYFIRGDESSLLRDGDVDVRAERLNNGWTQETVARRNGAQVITVRDQGGFIIYRSRIRPNGREVVLIDNREMDDRAVIDFNQQLPPLQLTIPQDRYVVPARQANYDVIYQTFAAPPVQKVEQAYSLRQVRESERLRDLVRRVDLDTITFDTGQAIVRQSQVPLLEDLARASIALIERDPSTVLLIEGHTDAVGSDISNLALSDRRAETVARILANFYGVPPESMVVQGYGESYLKVATQGAEESNRRVTIRNITQLLGSR